MAMRLRFWIAKKRISENSSLRFLREWQRATSHAYHPQYGLYAALPIVWGCLDAFMISWAAAIGFLGMALFLEGRPNKRLAIQTMMFVLWAAWLGRPAPAAASEALTAAREAAPAHETAALETLEGKVSGFPSLKGDCAFDLNTSHGAFHILAETAPFPILPGQALRISARALPPLPPTNPGQFDYPAYLRSQGLQGAYRAEAVIRMQDPGWIDRLIAVSRSYLQSGLQRLIPARQRPLVEAALLGITDDVDPALIDDFKSSGMLHILAISGQHVGILALILLQLFSLLRLPRKAAFLVTGALLGLYVPVSGGSVSVLRSAVMFWAALPGVLWERPGMTLNNLGWAAVFCLLWMPCQILSLGFQLSFAATYFLVAYSSLVSAQLARLRIRNPIAVYVVGTCAFTFVIYLGVYPLLAGSVHAVAPSSLIGNLATVGLSTGMISAACLSLLSRMIPFVGACLGETAGLFAKLLEASVHALAGLPGAAQSVATLPVFWSLLLILLVAAFPFALRTGRGRGMALMGLAVFSGRWAYAEAMDAWHAPVCVSYLDVGQGDGALCRLSGANILIDAGPIPAGKNVILPYLRFSGINRLDAVIITHPDLDHYGGLAYLARHCSISAVYFSGEETQTQAWTNLESVLAKRGIPMIAVRRGQILYRNGHVTLEILSPDHLHQFPSKNDNSVVSLLATGRRRFLFTGDMEAPPQRWMISHPDPRLQGCVLKVPHHGSDRTIIGAFFKMLKPETAVISVGQHNRFGHPGPGAVEALQDLGSRTFLTSRDGAILYSESGQGAAACESWVCAGATAMQEPRRREGRAPLMSGGTSVVRKNVN